MSFYLSSQNARLEGSTLIATLTNGEGAAVESSIDLNTIIGNQDGWSTVPFSLIHFLPNSSSLMYTIGRFFWGGADFAASAENLRFALEGDNSVPVLRAQLRNAAGELVDADLNLGERLGNNNGQFTLSRSPDSARLGSLY